MIIYINITLKKFKSSGQRPPVITYIVDPPMHDDDTILLMIELNRWWRNMKWDKKLCFARDRLVENFLWTIGVSYLPQFSYGRRVLTKVNALITIIDDVYGTLDELEKFTDVIDRWDINAIEELPDYMKISFLGFYNTINEISYKASPSIPPNYQIITATSAPHYPFLP